MYMGSNTRGGEKCSGQILISFFIHYRQNDAQEICIPSYSHFVRWLEEPYIAWIFVTCSVHDNLVGLSVNDVDFFVVKKC